MRLLFPAAAAAAAAAIAAAAVVAAAAAAATFAAVAAAAIAGRNENNDFFYLPQRPTLQRSLFFASLFLISKERVLLSQMVYDSYSFMLHADYFVKR